MPANTIPYWILYGKEETGWTVDTSFMSKEEALDYLLEKKKEEGSNDKRYILVELLHD